MNLSGDSLLETKGVFLIKKVIPCSPVKVQLLKGDAKKSGNDLLIVLCDF